MITLLIHSGQHNSFVFCCHVVRHKWPAILQVVIGLGSANDLINGLTAVAPYVTDLSVFTTTNTATAIQIYDAVRGCWP